jgi:hypothetical protein
MAKTKKGITGKLVQIDGRWEFGGDTASYLGPIVPREPVGVCLSPSSFRTGVARVRVKFSEIDRNSAAQILFGYNPATGAYFYSGLGGHGLAYLINMFVPQRGWQVIAGRGATAQLSSGREYSLEIQVRGQHVSLSVDGVRAVETALPTPLAGNQGGLFAWGEHRVEFTELSLIPDKMHAFVVMHFGEPYDSLYTQVINPVANELNFDVSRADDVFRPGVILQDITRAIVEADVIIAEITPPNPNVFYELGFAHALRKPTILLANRNMDKLPFDISGYRVVFYDDSIGGKQDVEESLKKYLKNIQAPAFAYSDGSG